MEELTEEMMALPQGVDQRIIEARKLFYLLTVIILL